MSERTYITLPPPAAPPESAAATTPDPRIARAEQRLAMLRELAELGMALARELTRRTLEAPEDPPAVPAADPTPDPKAVPGPRRDPANAFARLSRAIRLTLALEAKTDEALADLRLGIVRERACERARAAERAKAAAADARERRMERVRELVEAATEAAIEDLQESDDVCRALEERLDEDEACVDCAERPLRETVECLCRDLALGPDWSRRAGEGWIVEDPPRRPLASPFHRPSARPVLGPWPPEASRQPAAPPGAHALE